MKYRKKMLVHLVRLPCAHQVGGYSFCLVHRLVHRLVRRLVQLWLMYFASAGTLCKGLVCLGFALCRPCATRKSPPWLFWHLRTAPNFNKSSPLFAQAQERMAAQGAHKPQHKAKVLKKTLCGLVRPGISQTLCTLVFRVLALCNLVHALCATFF